MHLPSTSSISHTTYSISNPVEAMVTANFNFYLRVSYIGKLILYRRYQKLCTRRFWAATITNNPSQWRFFPHSQDKKSVEKDNLSKNPRLRKYVSGLNCVIRTVSSPMLDQNNQPECRMENSRLEAKWLKMIWVYRDLIRAASKQGRRSLFR